MKINLHKKEPIFLDIETTGLNPTYGNRITCICGKTQTDEFKDLQIEEPILLNNFKDWLSNYSIEDYLLVTKNGKMFDIPFIMTRWSRNNNWKDLEFLLEYEHFDLHEITKSRVSLDDMTRLYGIENKSASGLEAIKFWENKEYQKIIDYCWDDVLITEKIYNIYNKLKRSKK